MSSDGHEVTKIVKKTNTRHRRANNISMLSKDMGFILVSQKAIITLHSIANECCLQNGVDDDIDLIKVSMFGTLSVSCINKSCDLPASVDHGKYDYCTFLSNERTETTMSITKIHNNELIINSVINKVIFSLALT